MKLTTYRLLFSLVLAVLFLLVNGYYFNTGDQSEHLPQVYQLLDPQLYPHDYFVPYSNSVFTVRFYFEQTMLLADRLMGIELFCFVATILCLVLMIRSIMGITREIFGQSQAEWIAPILSLFIFIGFTAGGNQIIYPTLISSTLAKSFAAFALWKFLQNRYVLSGSALGVATLFQPLVGLQLMAMIIGARFITKPFQIKALLAALLPFLFIASWIIVPIVTRQLQQGVQEDQTYWEIFFRFRNYHHYLPSLFPIGHFVKMIALTCGGTIILFWAKPRHWKFLLGMVMISVLGMMIYSAAIETMILPTVGKTQWFKTSIWVGLIGSIAVSGSISALIRPLGSINPTKPAVMAVIAIVGIILITNSAYVPLLGKRYMVGNYVRTDLEKMYSWIEKNTPEDVTVLTPPNDNSFSCQAKRSIPVQFTAIVHEPVFMLNWYALYSRIYGITLESINGTNAKQAAVDLYGNRNYNADIPKIDMRLDDLSTCSFANDLGPLIHQEGKWILTEYIPKSQ